MKKTLVFLVLIFIGSMHAQKVQLQMNLKKGETYYQNISSQVLVNQVVQGTPMKIDIIITGKMSYKVLDIHNGVFDMEVRYNSMGISMDMPGKKMEFSSGKDDLFSGILSSIIDKPFRMKVNILGRVSEVSGLNALFDEMLKGFENLDEAQKEQFKSQVEQSYGEDAIRKNFETTFSFFPEKPVAIGDKWTVHTSTDAGIQADIETVYELKATSGDYYTLIGNAKITPQKGEDKGNALQDVTGKMVSDIKLNKATGWVASAKISQEIEGSIVVEEEKMTMKMVNEMILTD